MAVADSASDSNAAQNCIVGAAGVVHDMPDHQWSVGWIRHVVYYPLRLQPAAVL